MQTVLPSFLNKLCFTKANQETLLKDITTMYTNTQNVSHVYLVKRLTTCCKRGNNCLIFFYSFLILDVAFDELS